MKGGLGEPGSNRILWKANGISDVHWVECIKIEEFFFKKNLKKIKMISFYFNK